MQIIFYEYTYSYPNFFSIPTGFMFIENVIFQPRPTPSESYINLNCVFYKYLNPLDSFLHSFRCLLRMHR
jgi:hypothetical protein